MTTVVESFLGRELEIPEDRQYHSDEGVWLKPSAAGSYAVGLTEPALLMAGMIRDVEPLVEEGTHVEAGTAVILVLTARLKYLALPVSGTVTFAKGLKDCAARLTETPYDVPLLFIVPDRTQLMGLLDAVAYAHALRDSEGCRNPGGHKGGVSPTCKAVYMGLGQQRLVDHPDG
jgi:glycine cleavage system H lipoate-binding protein